MATPSQRDSSRFAQTGPVLFAVFQNDSRANGGVESVTHIIEGLGDIQRIVVTNADTPVTERWRCAGAETLVWRLPYVPGVAWQTGGPIVLARRLVNLLATNWWTWLTLRRRGVTAVHCNDPAPFWHVAVGARLAGVPLVLNLRDTKSRNERFDVAKYRRRFRWCTRVLVLSREMKAFYERASFLRRGRRLPDIDHIYSVVDFRRMRPLAADERLALRRRLGIGDETFAVGFIATFNDKKNQLDYLRRAVPILRDICPAARTFFVGDFEPESNAYPRSCAEFARFQGVEDRVCFVGFCSEVEKWYQACDTVVVPTRKEGLARCMIEALACGTPVVSFDVSSAREIIQAYQCGRIVAQGDYERLCNTIAELAQTPDLRKDYAANGTAAARRLFSAETCLEKYRRLVLNLKEEPLAAPRRLASAIQP